MIGLFTAVLEGVAENLVLGVVLYAAHRLALHHHRRASAADRMRGQPTAPRSSRNA
jgi:hypothetical protein